MLRWRNTLKIITPPPPKLCFTANTAWSTIRLSKTWSPTAVSLEISTDLSAWSDYTIWDTITLTNIWDNVYMRNKSETPTWFSTDSSNYYKFVISWSVAWSWDINYLLCKNSTTTLSDYCYYGIFNNCDLTTSPKLTATTLAEYCYWGMFSWCVYLETLPELPATELKARCYSYMFEWCWEIKLSKTQTWGYQTPYRIPTTWTWTTASAWNAYMFTDTWWTFVSNPSINTTYYTSNTIV